MILVWMEYCDGFVCNTACANTPRIKERLRANTWKNWVTEIHTKAVFGDDFCLETQCLMTAAVVLYHTRWHIDTFCIHVFCFYTHSLMLLPIQSQCGWNKVSQEEKLLNTCWNSRCAEWLLGCKVWLNCAVLFSSFIKSYKHWHTSLYAFI